MKILFRADGNPQLGMGHIMRCLSLADQLKMKGAECCFCISPGTDKMFILNKGYRVIFTQSKWDDYDVGIDVFCDMIRKEVVDMLIVDSYYVGESFFQRVWPITKTVYITEDDPNGSFDGLDYFLNYNAYVNDSIVQNVQGKTRFLLGSWYALLRDEFKMCVSDETRKNALIVLTGGSDPLNIAVDICAAIEAQKEFRKYQINIVSGSLNPHISELLKMEKRNSRIRVFVSPSKMSKIYLENDIAISAGGSTLYELCSCKVPTISYIYADNQRRLAEYLDKIQLIPYAGDMRIDRDQVINQIISYLIDYLENCEKWNMRRKAMKDLCDGAGAERVAKVFISEQNR